MQQMSAPKNLQAEIHKTVKQIRYYGLNKKEIYE